jgi:hypothetical protein
VVVRFFLPNQGETKIVKRSTALTLAAVTLGLTLTTGLAVAPVNVASADQIVLAQPPKTKPPKTSTPPPPTSSTTPTPPPTSTTPPPSGTVDVTAFGANGADTADDTAAINAAQAQLTPGGTLLFPAGNYRHNTILRFTKPDTTISAAGATLTATNEAFSAIDINADRVTVNDLTAAVANTTKRWEGLENHKILVSGQTGVKLNRVHVTGSAAAGIYIDLSTQFAIDAPTVDDTRADGIHITNRSTDGTVTGARVNRVGDDGVAVVSYDKDGGLCERITVTDARVVANYWGRGLTVVGGRDVTFRNVYSENSSFAGIYIGIEPGYATGDVANVKVEGAEVVRANLDTRADYGSLMAYNGRADRTLSNVTFQDVIIRDTAATASRDVGLIGTGPVSAVSYLRFNVSGGPAQAFKSDYPEGTATLLNWTVNGAPFGPQE